jgi:lipoprotein-anchoring transpeptidase ErfK/SrfK
MRSLAGCVALAVLLAGGPLAAEEEDMEAIAAVGAAAVATAAPGNEAAAQAKDAALATAPPAAASDGMAPTGAPTEPAAAPPPPPPPPVTLVLKADLGAQRLTVIENGKAKYTWPISSGRRGFATPTGTFRPQWASKMWHSRQYEWAPMPHAVFFHRGTAFHGTSAVRLLGSPASHGCVRLAPGNAAQLFALVHRHGYASTKVIVHNGSKGRDPAVARRSRDGGRSAVASARSAPRSGYRVSRYNNRSY